MTKKAKIKELEAKIKALQDELTACGEQLYDSISKGECRVRVAEAHQDILDRVRKDANNQKPFGYYEEDFGFNLPEFFSNQQELLDKGKLQPLYTKPIYAMPLEGTVNIPREVLLKMRQHLCLAYNNLNDMPISDEWAEKWADKALPLIEQLNLISHE